MAGKTKTKNAPKVRIQVKIPTKKRGKINPKLFFKLVPTESLPFASTINIVAICRAEEMMAKRQTKTTLKTAIVIRKAGEIRLEVIPAMPCCNKDEPTPEMIKVMIATAASSRYITIPRMFKINNECRE